MIKIGVTNSHLSVREAALASFADKPMRVQFALGFDAKHFEYAEILKEEANYAGSPYSAGSIKRAQSFGVDTAKTARKIEKFFKKKLADHVIEGMGSEWFTYSPERLQYIERMFIAIYNCENSAVLRVILHKF